MCVCVCVSVERRHAFFQRQHINSKAMTDMRGSIETWEAASRAQMRASTCELRHPRFASEMRGRMESRCSLRHAGTDARWDTLASPVRHPRSDTLAQTVRLGVCTLIVHDIGDDGIDEGEGSTHLHRLRHDVVALLWPVQHLGAAGTFSHTASARR